MQYLLLQINETDDILFLKQYEQYLASNKNKDEIMKSSLTRNTSLLLSNIDNTGKCKARR